MKTKFAATAFVGIALVGVAGLANAQTIVQDTFVNGSTTQWQPFLGACLTAGDGTGTVPACVGNAYYGAQVQVGGFSGTLPDPLGQGALRFTNGAPSGYNQAGGVISLNPFDAGQGLQVTFTTMTYEGDSRGAGGDGADGISFFLIDGNTVASDLGAFGGSLGYTCSNVNNDSKVHPRTGFPRAFDGLPNAYLGLGIDEYGNFLNQGDNTASGYGYQPGRIGLRGAGDIAWDSLHARFPVLYPSSLTGAQRGAAVQNTCSTGFQWDYSNAAAPVITAVPLPDYAPIPGAYQVLPATTKIANEAATTRGQARAISYLLKITQNGLLSFSYSVGGAYLPVITAQNITAGNGPLPSKFLFGFAGSTGGSTNIHEVTCFLAAPVDTSASSAGLNEKQTAQLQTGTQVYFAFYNASSWSGSLTAQNLVTDPITNLVSIAAVANWDASCVLTGVLATGKCQATAVAGPTAAQGPAARSILTWNGTTGVPFVFANLTAAQQATIDYNDAVAGTPNRVNYLRGERSNEINAAGAGLFRARVSVLGDIVDSSPTWVGAPSLTYPAAWRDKINAAGGLPENAGPTYSAFTTANATRLNVVYSGANDGLLHAFRSGFYSATNVYQSALNDGKEVLAYMPGAVVNSIHDSVPPAGYDPTLDFSSPQYSHNYYVDAPPGTGDLYYQGAWHTWLVGGLGAGGPAIYALDITDPTRFSEGNAATLVVGEWTPASLACSNVAGCGANLGNTYGVPQVRRLHNGMWGVIFGNGLSSAIGAAGIYVLTIDPASGAKTVYYLAATANSAGNGIAYATPADLDGDHIVDYVYAGDVQGNVWRFDLTSALPSNWAVSPGGPLFSTGGKPITTKLVVAAAPPSASSGLSQVVVDFGTGQQFPLTNTTPTSYAAGVQSLYGFWDWNMSSWNSKGSTQYRSVASVPSTPIVPSNLTAQTISTVGGGSFRTVSTLPVCWYNSTTCGAGMNVSFGWTIDLPVTSEQVIYSPVLEVGAFLVNTTIPGSNNPYNCQAANAGGWTMAISPITGGAFTQSFFGDSGGHFVNVDGKVVSGAALSGTGSVSIVTTGGAAAGTFLVTQTTSGVGVVLPINPLANASGNRLTWIEKR